MHLGNSDSLYLGERKWQKEAAGAQDNSGTRLSTVHRTDVLSTLMCPGVLLSEGKTTLLSLGDAG